MTRREFIKISTLLGITIPSSMMLGSCGKSNSTKKFSGTVLIVGCGVAGMTLAYILKQNNISFKILEAASVHGGRIKRDNTFTDFPIPLGAEWIHTNKNILKEIVNDSSINISTKTKEYTSNDSYGYYDVNLTVNVADKSTDIKFLDSTWFDFFNEYIYPDISENIIFNTQVTAINYDNDEVHITDSNALIYEANKVVVTVPIQILKDGDITFTPILPISKSTAIGSAPIWGGLKVFLEFNTKFFPTFLEFPDSETNTGQRLYYDASYGQDSSKNILGLFAIGTQALQYQNANSLEDYILNELDTIFANTMASDGFVKLIVQDWSTEPFIRSAYLADIADSSISNTLATSINNKVFFAGEAYTKENDWGAVHNALYSAKDVADEILD